MRPRLYYAAYSEGRIFGVFHGAAAARKALGGSRCYKAFKTRQAAEEFAAWHNYERDLYQELEERARRERLALRMEAKRRANGKPL